jgi:two-component system sensor kinase FixL
MRTPPGRAEARRRPPVRSVIRRYLVAAGAFVAALLSRYLLADLLGSDAPYLLFSPAVIAASMYGGLGPGALATMLSAAAAAYLFMPPDGFAVTGPGGYLSLGIFAVTGLVIAWLSQRLHESQHARGDAADTALVRAERLDAILNTTTDGIIVIDSRGIVETFNPAAERLFGYSRQEVVGRNVSMLMPSPFREEHDGYVSRYLQTGHARVIGIGREVTGRRKDGRLFPLRLSVGEFRAGGERKFTGVLHDLTARVQMESALRERDALAKLGELAAVVAHEVKNPLAGISGAIQVLDSSLAGRGERLPVLREIIERIGALDRMLRELLMFARPLTPRPTPVEIVPLLVSTAALLSADPELHDVAVDVTGDAPPIMADREMLRVVFHNVLVNGAQAMDGQGRIDVAVRANAALCQVTIADNGPGLSDEARRRLFTPFFTTKKRGTGLGLPTARRFVEAHGGDLQVECRAGGGTTVELQLPITPQET